MGKKNDQMIEFYIISKILLSEIQFLYELH